jgi:hypothetical protein
MGAKTHGMVQLEASAVGSMVADGMHGQCLHVF